ncbi:MAG: ATP-binding protein [Muribaculum sp.]|nr:ATP-binding protein [Muribaculum sp.]
MKDYNAKTGKHLIQILMFSMYNDQRIIYREYIQNAYDAINRAVKQGILSKIKDGIVDVRIDAEAQRISIRDNGIGIQLSEVNEKLLNIADSRKDGVTSAGQYGIGRLAGAGYCKWLRFKTSYKGESAASIVSFDVDFANQIINDVDDLSSATEVIDIITNKETVPENEDEHYFEVVLEGVSKEYRDLLNPTAISEYLKEIAPIDYSMKFKNVLFSPSVNNAEDVIYKELYDQIGNVAICVNGESEIRKRYNLKIDGTGDEIDSLEFFKVQNDRDELLAWGWYAVTLFTKQIPVSDTNRGIRLRKHNIQLGTSDLLNKYFSEARGNNYFYGEVFATHPNLRPNSDRSGLAPTPETEILFDKLKLIFKNLGKLYTVANNVKNAVKKVSLAVDKLTAGIETDGQHIQAEIKLAEAELTKVENSTNAQSQVAKRVIELHKNKAREKKNEVSKKKDRLSHKKTESTFQQSSQTDTNIYSQQVIDIFGPLHEKFTEKEIVLIRRVFTYMTQACPAASEPVLEQLKLHAINQLRMS